jgi:hypothetical protein
MTHDDIMATASHYSEVDAQGYVRFCEDDLINFAQWLMAQPVEQTAPPGLTASFIDSVLSELWPLRPAVNERGHGTFEAVRSEIRLRLTEATVAQPVEQTRALTEASCHHLVREDWGNGTVTCHDCKATLKTAARPASGETE